MSRYPEFCSEYRRFASFHLWIPPEGEWIIWISANGYFWRNHHIICFACGEERPNHAQNCQRRQLNVPVSNFLQDEDDTTSTSSDCLVHPGEMGITLRPRNDEEVFAVMNVTLRPRRRQGQAPDNQAQPRQPGDQGSDNVHLHLRTGGNSGCHRTDFPVNSHYRMASSRFHHLAQFVPAHGGSYTEHTQTQSTSMASGEGRPQATPSSSLCRKCCLNPVKMIFQPCGHLVCCEGCARAEACCPLCGEAIQACVWPDAV